MRYLHTIYIRHGRAVENFACRDRKGPTELVLPELRLLGREPGFSLFRLERSASCMYLGMYICIGCATTTDPRPSLETLTDGMAGDA